MSAKSDTQAAAVTAGGNLQSIPNAYTPILIVDDDPGLLMSIRAVLESAGLPEPALVSDGNRIMDLLSEHPFHLVLLDLILPDASGIELLRRMKVDYPDVECLVVTALDDVPTAVEAIKYGAFDYLVKPLKREKLVIAVQNALQRHDLLHKVSMLENGPFFSELSRPEAFSGMISEDLSMARVFHEAETYAANDYNLVITGETGVGKDMLARIIHRLSPRSPGPFMPVSMPALSWTLFENDLFGHSKGAYTGAFAEKKGFFEEAHGGTLFLDEITELDPALQGAILRVIQERELYRLGSTRAKKVDVRIIAATNRDLQEEVRRGRFRSDLYYRLNVCHIHIPPLRERRRDILPLARHFLAKHAAENEKAIGSLDAEAARRLQSYAFPGNVRELENLVASAVLVENGERLTARSLPSTLSGDDPVQGGKGSDLLPLSEVEKRHIQAVLQSTGGNRTRAARILGIGLRTLQRRLNAHPEIAPKWRGMP
ncbi:MAG: sigma-54 dependent transcriptional regulator [Deltaproteobacteria bacterium]|nr:sigma-54 dependent transcriptional regulator [Deltaproteobacteria bacterium]